MKLIKPSVEIIEQQPGEIGMLKHIETCGRVAWKSEERTTDDSYIKFIDMLKGVNHGSVLEHGTVYLEINDSTYNEYFNHEAYLWNSFIDKYKNSKYSKVTNRGNRVFITTNYRHIIENNWLEDLKYQCEPTEFHEKRVTVKFICDRGILAEFTRHRSMSMTAESTRYCNYSKDKFGNELTFIIPCWCEEILAKIEDKSELSVSHTDIQDGYTISSILRLPDGDFMLSLCFAEDMYLQLIEKDWKPQQARAVLPNALKTELIMTGFISDWRHFLKLRCDKSAHPQAQELANMLLEKTQVFN